MSVIHSLISRSLNINLKNVESTLKLLDEGGATIPFISRYRKEVTGGLDEVQIASIKELNLKYLELEKRKEYVLKSITEQERLTPELEKKLQNAGAPLNLKTFTSLLSPSGRHEQKLPANTAWSH